MESEFQPMKKLSLKDIQKVIDSLQGIADPILNGHSLAMLIGSTGETTFTSCGSKLLSAAGFSHPLTKLICDSALNYTNLCGEDCKYFLLFLREVFSFMHNKLYGNGDVFVRKALMNDLCSVKQILPCILKTVRIKSGVQGSYLCLGSFHKDLFGVVNTFMASRYTSNASKVLSTLVCEFIENISGDTLISVLEYVILHFDIFCCKTLSSLTASKVLKGFLFYKKDIPLNVNIQNCKFIIVLDLSIKNSDISWKITNDSFMFSLNSADVYDKIFEYFKSQNIMLILSPSIGDSSIKLLCKKYGIFLLDRLEKEEIDCMLTCYNLYALENLNEYLEPFHIGELSFAKSFSCNKSYFLHLNCESTIRLFSACHILLSAPCNAVWNEYYSECLNCFKMLYQWLKSETTLQRLSIYNDDSDCVICSESKSDYEDKILLVQDKNSNCDICLESKHDNTKCQKLLIYKKNSDCISSESKCDYENESPILHNKCKLNKNSPALLAPCVWELAIKNMTQKILTNSKFSSNIALQAMQYGVVKCLCSKTGILFKNVKNIDNACREYIQKCNVNDNFLEPVVCKEIMICNVLDLILQLLKIESIIFTK